MSSLYSNPMVPILALLFMSDLENLGYYALARKWLVSFVYHKLLFLSFIQRAFLQVDIEINSEPRDIHMKLGESGEAFFVEEVAGSDGYTPDTDIPPHLACSPIPNIDCFPKNRR